MKRKDLQQLSAIRLREAKALLKANCPDGAYYLAGYARRVRHQSLHRQGHRAP